MLNQVIIVGRVVEDIIVETTEENKKMSKIKIAVSRSYKNADGIYETDFITCILWNGIAENTADFCKKGDVVGIKGRLQTEDGNLQIIAEKLTFLSSKRSDNEEIK